MYYRSVPRKRPLLGERQLPGKRPGNMSQNHSDNEADKHTYKDNGDVDNLDPFSDSDE